MDGFVFLSLPNPPFNSVGLNLPCWFFVCLCQMGGWMEWTLTPKHMRFWPAPPPMPHISGSFSSGLDSLFAFCSAILGAGQRLE